MLDGRESKKWSLRAAAASISHHCVRLLRAAGPRTSSISGAIAISSFGAQDVCKGNRPQVVASAIFGH